MITILGFLLIAFIVFGVFAASMTVNKPRKPMGEGTLAFIYVMSMVQILIILGLMSQSSS